jgi:hypothetical protein
VWQKHTRTRPLFPKAHLGARYQAARVAVSKAFRRLEQRGIARRGYYADVAGHRSLGLVLTPTGMPLARQALNRRFGPQWQAQYEALRARGSHIG